MPETHETIAFDTEGVCNICRQHERKKGKIDWKKREQEFRKTVERYKNKGVYDCIIPISGGKDSTFILYSMLKRYKVRPLVLSFDHCFYRPHHIAQRDRILRKLGVDFLILRTNPGIVKKLMLESLKRTGDFCWHCHTGVFAWPMQIAIKYKIPLLIWGESAAEYTTYYDFEDLEDQDDNPFNTYINLGISAEDMAKAIGGEVTLRNLEPYTYPPVSELKKIGCRSICYGAYHKWDVRRQVALIKKELGWEEDEVEGIPQKYWYTKVECIMSGVRDYLKFVKRGFGRTSQLTTDDIRAGYMSRREAVKLVKKYDGRKPASLSRFLEFVGITEDEFNEIAAKHFVKPWECDPKKLKEGKRPWDQNEWDFSGI